MGIDIGIYYIHLINVFIEQVFIFEFDPYADRKSMDKNADFFSLPLNRTAYGFLRICFSSLRINFLPQRKKFYPEDFFLLALKSHSLRIFSAFFF